jgi:outer membrane protein insertion porin family
LLNVDKGEKIKIEEIDFIGNEKYQIKLYEKMKDTKQKKSFILKASKFRQNTKPI